ncbi:unnamed protein product [Brachionus calyciflorus]|uniref:Uncharacterized protein n=1 Tax=Brachionus calyciflorus TaxID=104777 RepID=A0A813Q690_9BILA|nr:unnamed protein product [Brachionus calyciflorus]
MFNLKLVINLNDTTKRLKCIQIEFFLRLLSNEYTKAIIKDLLSINSGGDYIRDFLTILNEGTKDGSNGIAGLRRVDVSSSRIEELKDEIEYREYTQDDGKAMFDLYFVRLILHEITHVLIRIKKDNMNASSRFITGANLEK